MESQKRTIWDFFIKNSKFTGIIVLTAMLFGAIAATQMPKESQPEVVIPIGVVSTVFPGASVVDVEELVTNVIEDKITSLDEVKKITSVSRRGVSAITVEFLASADSDKKINELKDLISEVQVDLPEDATDPFVQQVSLDDAPFLTLAVSGPFDLPQVKLYAEEIKDEIERTAGVSTVQIFGGQERQVEVIVNKAKLHDFGLSVVNVTQAIERANSDVPIGSIITAEEEFTLRFSGRINSIDDIKDIPITSINNTPVFVRDVATIIDTYTESNKLVRLSTEGNASDSAVTIRVFKNSGSGGDVTKIAKNIFAQVETLKQEKLPESLTVISIENLAEQIDDDLSSLTKNAVATVIIVTILLALLLGWREAILAAISIPLSFMMTFIILFYAGYTINFMTLFSLILSSGILVDSTIVINESLNKQMKKEHDPEEAAKKSIRELQFPLIAGTLTTVFAFVPMLLTSGILGQFIKSIPITVSAVLMSSLFVALGVITTLSVVLTKYDQKRVDKKKNRKAQEEKYFTKLFIAQREGYREYLKGLLHNRKKQVKITIWLIIAMIGAYALPITGVLKAELFPPADQTSFSIDIQNAFGTPLTKTMEDLQELETELRNDDRIQSLVLNAGFSASLGSAAGGGEGAHLGYIMVNLKDKGKERKQKSFEIVDEYQQKFNQEQSKPISVTQSGYGPGSGAPVEVTIAGDDLAILDSLAQTLKEKIENIQGTQNVKTSVVQTNGQFVINVNRGKASQYGVSTADIAITLRNAITGLDATKIQEQGEDINVLVRTGLQANAALPETNRRITDIATIEGLSLVTPRGEIPLSSVVDISLENNRSAIQHENGNRVVKVTSYITSDVSAGEIFTQVEKILADTEIPEGYIVSTGGEDEDTAQSLQDMFRAMILAVILIAALLVLQFKSFRQSLIILMTIPLALIGVFPGLLLLNLPLSFPGMIGIVALAGIVVNNAIILIDKINTNRNDGMTMDDAIVDAGASRFEPIILTTITTLSGLLPLALTEPIWSSLGFAIIFGLLFSTILTLIVIPLLYKKFYRKELAKESSVAV